MKKLFLSLIAILSIATVSAQNFSWGIKAGVNLASVTSQESSGIDSKVDFVGGVFAEIKTCDWFGVSADVLYSGQGYKNSESDMFVDLSYINVPILANFYVAKNLSLKTGLQPGFLIGQQSRQGSEKVKLDNYFETFTLSVPVAIAYQLNCGLLFDLRYNFDVTKINKFESNNVYNSVVALTVGWRF